MAENASLFRQERTPAATGHFPNDPQSTGLHSARLHRARNHVEKHALLDRRLHRLWLHVRAHAYHGVSTGPLQTARMETLQAAENQRRRNDENGNEHTRRQRAWTHTTAAAPTQMVVGTAKVYRRHGE